MTSLSKPYFLKIRLSWATHRGKNSPLRPALPIRKGAASAQERINERDNKTPSKIRCIVPLLKVRALTLSLYQDRRGRTLALNPEHLNVRTNYSGTDFR